MNSALFSSRLAALRDRVAAACARSGKNPCDVRTVVVTKTHPVETVQMVLDSGIRDIAENRVQEIAAKVPRLAGTFEMHLIGHLQTNKVGTAVPLVSWVQSIDSMRLAAKVDAACQARGKKLRVMVQVKTAPEETKSGCAPESCVDLAAFVAQCKGLELCGLMTIGPLGGSESATRGAFGLLRELADRCAGLAPAIGLSMGMSSDFEWAIEEGATIIRVGSLLLGDRPGANR